MKNFLKYLIVLSIFLSNFVAPLVLIQRNSQVTNNKYYVYAGNNNDASIRQAKEQIDEYEKQQKQQKEIKDDYLSCHFFDISCGLINLLQRIVVGAGNFLVGISAIFMDYFLGYSIQSAAYKDQGFITQGWEIIRDMTNIVFIFALIIVAFNLVLGNNSSDAKGKLMKIILISLVINFSLFGVFVIIDTSNVLAHVFYNKIGQNNTTYKASESDSKNSYKGKSLDITEKSASLDIAAKIQPQKLLATVKGDPSRSRRVIIIIIIGVINAVLIYTFLSVSFLFLGRTVGLWIAAVLSPLALASITIPGMDNLAYIGFGKWLSSLLKMAFMAPVFLFFLYLSVKFMGVKIVYDKSGDFTKTILSIVVPMGAIVVLILTSKDITEKMAGDFAGTISKYVAKGVKGVAGVGLAVATSGAALAGRATIGRGAKAMMDSDRLKNFTEKNPWLGKKLYSGAGKMQKSSFDVNKSWAGKMAGSAAGAAGLSMKQPSWAKVGGSGSGGYKKYREKKDQEETDFKDWITDKEADKAAQEAGHAEKEISSKSNDFTNLNQEIKENEALLPDIDSEIKSKEKAKAANEQKELKQEKELFKIKQNKKKLKKRIVNKKVFNKEREIKKTQKEGLKINTDIKQKREEKEKLENKINKDKSERDSLGKEINELGKVIAKSDKLTKQGRTANRAQTFVDTSRKNSEKSLVGKSARVVGAAGGTVALTIALGALGAPLGAAAGTAVLARGIKELIQSRKGEKWNKIKNITTRNSFATGVENKIGKKEKELSPKEMRELIKNLKKANENK